MREILFRGKREDNGEWVFGSFIPDLLEVYQNGPDGWLGDWGFIKPFKKDENGRHDMVYVQRDTVGPYIGLTDKNGKKIFAGDIVTGYFNHERITGIIVYGSNAQYCINRNGLYGIYLDNAEDWLEIIGNRWDNPEFLEDAD